MFCSLHNFGLDKVDPNDIRLTHWFESNLRQYFSSLNFSELINMISTYLSFRVHQISDVPVVFVFFCVLEGSGSCEWESISCFPKIISHNGALSLGLFLLHISQVWGTWECQEARSLLDKRIKKAIVKGSHGSERKLSVLEGSRK